MNSINKSARMAGLLYLAIAILSAFGLVYVLGDAATANTLFFLFPGITV